VGERFTPHSGIREYVEALAAASDRVRLERYGETEERRPLQLLTITHRENLVRLDELRRQIALLSDPPAESDPRVAAALKSTPVVVWLSYGVHGNESSGSEAALQVAWHLAAAEGGETEELLRRVVVVLDPCLNPDGRDRYVSWFNSVVGAVPDPDPDAREHREPPPGGRTNHWLFDLNRDWAWLSQRETRARVRAFVARQPQVHVDFHEMSPESTYFFFPAGQPIHPNFPEMISRWGKVFGEGNARAFDAHGWSYYTRETFDLYYPAYGDSWPSLHGAIGMTYEQAGGGRAGLAYRREDGTVLTLRDRAHHHFTSSLATIRTAAGHREELLRDYARFRRSAVEDGRKGGAREFYLVAGADPGRATELATLLRDQGIRVLRAEEEFVAEGVRSRFGAGPALRTIPAGTWVIPLAQPLHRLIQTLLEPEAVAPEVYFYDVSAWSLPLAFGVEAGWTDRGGAGRRVEWTAPAEVPGRLVEGPARHGFLLPWERDGAVLLLARAWRAGVRAGMAPRRFRLQGRTFERGTIVFPRSGNPPDLAERLGALAREAGVEVFPAPTALVEDGPDLGSNSVRSLRTPRIALVSGPGIDGASFGAAWFLLTRRFELPVTCLSLADLPGVNLAEYTALVFPDGSAARYQAALGKEGVERVRRWITDGGTFVGIGGGGFFATKEVSGLTEVSQAAEGAPGAAPAAGRVFREEQERREREAVVPGVILRVDLDPAFPVAFGYGPQILVLKNGQDSFRLPASGVAAGVFPEGPRVSGWLAPEQEKALAGRAWVVEARLGRGHAVLFADDPNFRLFWRGLSRLFLNAVLLYAR
jgi:hypothetical protein